MQTEFNVNKITPTEEDFIEFMSERKNQPYRETLIKYTRIRNDFSFPSHGFTEFWCKKLHEMFSLEYLDTSEKDLIQSYDFYSLLHLYEMISLEYKSPTEFQKEAEFILNKISDPVIVDYGCGIAQISFEIAKMSKAKVYLLDLDTIILDFDKFRFKKYGFDFETIVVRENNFYPSLPVHNICICSEVLEHLPEPIRAFDNILKSLERGGLLYGQYYNYSKEFFHVSPDLSEIIKQIPEKFNSLDEYHHFKL